jgi:histidine ammonia-lyase
MRDKRRPAAKALKEAELSPLELNPQERSALLSGTSLSTAAALAGLFEAERVFHSALVATALSATAPPRPTIPLHPRVHRLYRQPGQIEVAASLRALTGMTKAGGAQVNDENGAEEKARRGAPLKMGACLDFLRQAGATLERAANAVTEDPVILWQSREVVAGAVDRSSVAGAADLIAKALTTIAELSAAHIAALTCAAGADGDADTEQANATARAGGFVGRIRELADRSSDMRRLLPMAGTATLVLAIEFLEAGRACDAAPEREAPELNDVLRLVREAAPHADEAGLFPAGDLAAIADRVGSGALAAAAGMPLPGVVRRPAEREASR